MDDGLKADRASVAVPLTNTSLSVVREWVLLLGFPQLVINLLSEQYLWPGKLCYFHFVRFQEKEIENNVAIGRQVPIVQR